VFLGISSLLLYNINNNISTFFMSFYDFVIRFWWLEVVMLMGIVFAVAQGFIAQGTAVLAGAVSCIVFMLLFQSGLE